MFLEIFDSVSTRLSQPDFIQFGPNLYGVSFSLMKILPAKFILEKALKERRISKNTLIVETSSGTFGLSIGIVCRELGLRFHIVGDKAIDKDLKHQMVLLGGVVDILKEKKEVGIQITRLKRVNDLITSIPDTFWPSQYDNSDIIFSYESFAQKLLQNFGSDFTLIAPVGSGGVSCGTTTFLRAKSPSIELIGVDTFGSILFGLENKKRQLRGLGNSILPRILNHSLFDQVHWMSYRLAILSTRELFIKKALYAGPTSGACYRVAEWIAQRNPEKKVVFISADGGHRYNSTVYNEHWIKNNGYQDPALSCPEQLIHPEEANVSNSDWCCYHWGRQTLQAVNSKRKIEKGVSALSY